MPLFLEFAGLAAPAIGAILSELQGRHVDHESIAHAASIVATPTEHYDQGREVELRMIRKGRSVR